jgi:hypothetical protein
LEKDSNTLVSLKIHLSTIKNTFLCFNIHKYTFQIHYNTFQKPYILLTYITIPLLYSNILLYTSIYIETIMKPLYYAPLCLVTKTIFQNCHGTLLFYQNVLHLPWHVYWNPKWSIFHESHKSCWFIEYLNPKLISWDPINIEPIYVDNKTISDLKVIHGINK